MVVFVISSSFISSSRSRVTSAGFSSRLLALLGRLERFCFVLADRFLKNIFKRLLFFLRVLYTCVGTAQDAIDALYIGDFQQVCCVFLDAVASSVDLAMTKQSNVHSNTVVYSVPRRWLAFVSRLRLSSNEASHKVTGFCWDRFSHKQFWE